MNALTWKYIISASLQRWMTLTPWCKQFIQTHTYTHKHTHKYKFKNSKFKASTPSVSIPVLPFVALFSFPSLSYHYSPTSCLRGLKVSSLWMHSLYKLSPHQLCQGWVLVLQRKQLTTTVSTIALTRAHDISDPVDLVAHRWQTATGLQEHSLNSTTKTINSYM